MRACDPPPSHATGEGDHAKHGGGGDPKRGAWACPHRLRRSPSPASRVRIGPGLALQPAACDRPPDRRRGSGLSAEAEGTWQPAPLRRGPPAPSPVIVGMMRIIGADDAHHHRRFPHHRRGFAASSSGFCRVIVGVFAASCLGRRRRRIVFHVKHRLASAPSALPRMAPFPAHAGEDRRRHRKSAALYRSDSSLGR